MQQPNKLTTLLRYRGFRSPKPLCPRDLLSTASALAVLFHIVLINTMAAQQLSTTRAQPEVPPPAPPIQYRPLPAKNTPSPHPLGLTLYSIGQPSDEEQSYLEYLNRMRAYPTAEGVRLANTTDPDVLSDYSYFQVDLSLMQSEFSTNPPVPPLAFNADLIAAARWHSGDMFTNQYQGHTQTNGGTVLQPWDRMTAEGYTWTLAGENVFAYAKSVFHGHAGFAVDWGTNPPSIGGMQNPPGHRENMLNSGFREVGIGVVDGVNGSVGPQLVTQDLGTQPAGTPFISGVVYYDFNGNGFYDVGEGIGGVTVNTAGSTYYAVTANSGGYTIPITANGSYSITFSASGLNTQTVTTVSSLHNVKVDYVPTYSPPVISGPILASLNQSNGYNFSTVGAASSYQWLEMQLVPYSYVEGGENGLTNVTAATSAGYTVITGDLVAAGSHSFHLAQPDGANQFITLNPVIRPDVNSQLSFAKLLGYATASQIAKAQVSSDGGGTWQDIWSQPGDGTSGDQSFSTIVVPLTSYSNQNIQIRFAYLNTGGGSYFNQTSAGVGLYLDSIAVSSSSQTVNQLTNNIAVGTSFTFVPSAIGQYLLQVRALIGNRVLNWGPGLTVTVAAAPPSIQLASSPVVTGGQVQISFTVGNYSPGMTFKLLKAANLSGAFAQDTSAALQTNVPNSKFSFKTPAGVAGQGFYRVTGTY